jgi:hypothetical protein
LAQRYQALLVTAVQGQPMWLAGRHLNLAQCMAQGAEAVVRTNLTNSLIKICLQRLAQQAQYLYGGVTKVWTLSLFSWRPKPPLA